MWTNPQGTVDLVTFTVEILNGKLLFLCSMSEELHYHIKKGEDKLFYMSSLSGTNYEM